MKVVILAGGRGTRISEETGVMPKPMVDIGGKPILWHIMKIYSHYGFNDFIICLGYKGYIIKEYFSHYFLHMSDVTIDMRNNEVKIHNSASEPWKITLIDTGQETMTGSRLKRVEKYLEKETFMLTYGDGVGDINIEELLKIHKNSNKYLTITAVQPTAKFGNLNLDKAGRIISFREKDREDGGWISGGFFVLEPQIFDYIGSGDEVIWEKRPLERLAEEQQVAIYKHSGFWKCMDTLRDKIELDRLWHSGKALWRK